MMLASSRRLGPLITSVRKCLGRNTSTWQIVVSAIVERPATLVRPFNALEKAYVDMLGELEAEQSLLSDHELQAREEEQARKRPGKAPGGAALRIKLREDLVKEWRAELDAFRKEHPYKPANLKLGDVNRHLDQTLTLLVRQKVGNQEFWLFPQVDNVEGETLRQSAERAVTECFGKSVEIQSIGNAPLVYYKYKYPKEVREQSGKEGAQVFYMKILYKSGSPVLNKAFGSDMIWTTHNEMLEYLPKVITKAVSKAFFVPPKLDFTPLLDTIVEKDELKKRQLIKE